MAIDFILDHKKFKRGTIWWAIDKEELEKDSTLLFDLYKKQKAKSSMVLIISTDISNLQEDNEYLTVLPCTNILDNKFSPVHVEAFLSGVKNSILCDRVKTISKRRLSLYVDKLNEYDLEKVNRALMISLGLKFNPEQEEKKQGIIKIDTKKLHEEIETTKKLRDEFEAHLINLEKMLQIKNPIINAQYKDSLQRAGFKIMDVPTRKRRSPEEIKNFIRDWEDKSNVRQSVAENYGFNSTQSAYSFYYNWKKKFNKTEA